MGDPIWIWPSGGPAVFSMQPSFLRLTVANQLWGAAPAYLRFDLWCVAIRLSFVTLACFNLRIFLLAQINSTDIHVGAKFEWDLSTKTDEVENFLYSGFLQSSLWYSLEIIDAESVFMSWRHYKNIKRHTAHTITSWHNPKQWQMVHTSDLMMIIDKVQIISQLSQET